MFNFTGKVLSLTPCRSMVTTAIASAQSMDELIDAAKAEGTLTTIALPHSWCNYGEVIQAFKDKYGLEVNELNPDAGSGDEIEAIKANKGNTGPQAPDVIDVGLSFGPSAKAEGLLEPYKVATWDTIPTPRRTRRPLVRRLLRRAGLRHQHGPRAESAAGLGGPSEGRIQGRGRARRRPAHLQQRHHVRLRVGPGGRRRPARPRQGRPRFLQAAE